jgi:hypothetical protein
MRYALLIYDNPGAYEGFTDEERKALSARYWALREEPGVADGETRPRTSRPKAPGCSRCRRRRPSASKTTRRL